MRLQTSPNRTARAGYDMLLLLAALAVLALPAAGRAQAVIPTPEPGKNAPLIALPVIPAPQPALPPPPPEPPPAAVEPVPAPPPLPPAPAAPAEEPAARAPEMEAISLDKPAESEKKPVQVAVAGQVKSLFFTPSELMKIRDAVATHKKLKEISSSNSQSQAQDFLNQLADPRKAGFAIEKNFVSPQFFLTSLAYHSPDDWMVGVNDEKIRPDTPKDRSWLKVLSVDKEKVLLEWKPLDMAQVNAVWEEGASEGIEVDRKKGVVRFTLYPNQTFSSHDMRVLEGRIRRVMPDAAKDEQGGKGDGADEAAPDADKKTGLSQPLTDTYRKLGLEP